MKNELIYTKENLVYPSWEPIMNALIKSLEDYVDEENSYANDLYISYVKDKYWCLRCEYNWGDEYTDNLINAVETLSFYIKWKWT